jgi:3-oxoacyl-[acyl-carrier-protein] synthase II
MELYIKGIGCISPQLTYDNSVFLPEIKKYAGNKMVCIEPDYSPYFDAGSLRRMSRMVKFSAASALIALKDSGITQLDAITTGTGYGLLENSEKFLKSIAEATGPVLSPTAFIQSTHNTVGATIALITGCNAHNNTFSHKGFSFESALIDARLMAAEGAANILAGAHDEIGEKTFSLMEKLNVFRNNNEADVVAYEKGRDGIVAGEGAAFFILSATAGESDYGVLVDNAIFYNPADTIEVKKHIEDFLESNHVPLENIDVVITGINGDTKSDASSYELNHLLFAHQTIVLFKHLCGEYMTASSFGFWLAAKMLLSKQVPESVILKNRHRQPKYILLYNVFENDHSIMLLKAC